MTIQNHLCVAALGLFALASAACRGGYSESPPVHLVQDMDFQQKLKAQSESPFHGWTDGRSMRTPVAGTVARRGKADETLEAHEKRTGAARLEINKSVDGLFVDNPLERTEANLLRGRERYDIFCAPCHGLSGMGGNGPSGHGMVGKLWPVAIPSFHVVPGADNRVPNLKDGEVFEVIKNGKGTMPAYAARIPTEDRWRIIHYLRALQNVGKQ